jgi:hypothetical protein
VILEKGPLAGNVIVIERALKESMQDAEFWIIRSQCPMTKFDNSAMLYPGILYHHTSHLYPIALFSPKKS